MITPPSSQESCQSSIHLDNLQYLAWEYMEAWVYGDKVSLPYIQLHKVPNGIEIQLHGCQTWAIYNIKQHDIFIPWFQTTPYYKVMQDHRLLKETCFNNPVWRNQGIWANFQEAADINSDEPALIYNFYSATI